MTPTIQPPLPARLRDIGQKATSLLADSVRARVDSGGDVISLATARPDFDTPVPVKTALINAVAVPHTYMTYTESRGLIELRQAIATKLASVNGSHYDPEQEILITAGTHEALYVALQALVEPGDEVILIDPSWAAYHGMVRLAGAEPVLVPLANDRLDVDAMRAAVTGRTRAILVNNPNNPTGTVFTVAELTALGSIAAEHGLTVLVDEIYEEFVYDGRRHVSLASLPGMRERTVLINGFSKAYAMTGWRVGYAAAPAWLIERMLIIHQHLISAPCSFAQKGAVAAYEMAREHVTAMVSSYTARRDRLWPALERLPGISAKLPEGACFFFLRYDADVTPEDFSREIAHRTGLLLTPGTAFGQTGRRHLRLSFAALPESLIPEVITRLETALEALVT